MHNPSRLRHAENCIYYACGFFAILFYGSFINTYAVNIPLTDDFYDILYFLSAYKNSSSIIEKLQLVIWQWDEYILVTNRLVYLAYYKLFGNINFRNLVWFAAMLQLVFLALALALLEAKNRALAFAVAAMALFTTAHHENDLWAIVALINGCVFLLFFVALILLDINKTWHVVAGGLIAAIVILSIGQGFLIIPIGLYLLLFRKDRPTSILHIMLWLLFCLPALFLFFKGQSNLSSNSTFNIDGLITIMRFIPDACFMFFGLIGAYVFKEGDPLVFPFLTGVVFASVTAIAFVKRNVWGLGLSRPGQSLFLFFLASIALCAFVRGPFYPMDYMVFNSRYTLYSGFLYALVLAWLTNSALLDRSILARIMVLASGVLIFLVANHRNANDVEKWMDYRDDDITRWSTKASHDSLGLSGWYAFTHEILVHAIQDGIYSPFTSHAILFQPAAIQPANCSLAGSQAPIVADVIAAHDPHSIAAKISLLDPQDRFFAVVLCGPESIQLDMDLGNVVNERGRKRIVFDATKIKQGIYSIQLLDHTGKQHQTNANISIAPYQPILNCDENQMQAIPSRKVIVKNICALHQDGFNPLLPAPENR